MKIGYFTDVYHPETNGVVMSIDIFGGELVKRGHKVSVIAPKPDRKKQNGMDVYYRGGIPFISYPGYTIAFPWGETPKLDIIHAHGPFSMGINAILVGHKQKIPLVATFHTMLPEYVHYFFPYGKRFTAQLAKLYCFYHYKYFDKIVVPSHVIKKKVGKWIGKNKAKDLVVITTGTDMEHFIPIKKSAARKKMKLEKVKGKIYLYLGRVGKEKNIDVLLKAAKIFLKKGDLLILAGKGPWEKKMHKWVDKLGLHDQVQYIGFMDRGDVPYCYASADLFITASESETQGLVLTEAMACGTHTIGPDALAIPEILKDGVNGYIFKAGDHKHLANIVMKKKFTPKMLKEGYKTANEFSIKSSVDKVEKLYKSLIEKKKK